MLTKFKGNGVYLGQNSCVSRRFPPAPFAKCSQSFTKVILRGVVVSMQDYSPNKLGWDFLNTAPSLSHLKVSDRWNRESLKALKVKNWINFNLREFWVNISNFRQVR